MTRKKRIRKEWRRVTLCFTEEEYRKLSAAAGLKGCSMTALVLHLLLPFLNSTKFVEDYLSEVVMTRKKRIRRDDSIREGLKDRGDVIESPLSTLEQSLELPNSGQP